MLLGILFLGGGLHYPQAQAAKFALIERKEVEVLEGPDKKFRVLKKLYEGDRILASNYPVQGFHKIRTKLGFIGWVPAEAIAFEKPLPAIRYRQTSNMHSPTGSRTSSEEAVSELPANSASEVPMDLSSPAAASSSGDDTGDSDMPPPDLPPP